MIQGVLVGGVVEFAEVVPLMFLAVTAMLIALTRLEQGLGRDRSSARTRAAQRRVARRGRRPRPGPPRRARPATNPTEDCSNIAA